mmetsp:Transcript_54749/g.146296  ORF Transcript_54749/g.146296 Transcript_54749/m.146296 type:complete len:229 (+) Transcript_54749:43-729(+)
MTASLMTPYLVRNTFLDFEKTSTSARRATSCLLDQVLGHRSRCSKVGSTLAADMPNPELLAWSTELALGSRVTLVRTGVPGLDGRTGQIVGEEDLASYLVVLDCGAEMNLARTCLVPEEMGPTGKYLVSEGIRALQGVWVDATEPQITFEVHGWSCVRRADISKGLSITSFNFEVQEGCITRGDKSKVWVKEEELLAEPASALWHGDSATGGRRRKKAFPWVRPSVVN